MSSSDVSGPEIELSAPAMLPAGAMFSKSHPVEVSKRKKYNAQNN
jgi:hypothetical protein